MLSKERDTVERAGQDYVLPVAAAVKCFQGGMAARNSGGYVRPATGAVSEVVVGRFDATVDNTGGGNGAVSVPVRAGVFLLDNSTAGDAITRADIGQYAYVVDDGKVAKTDNGGTRGSAGIVVDVDAAGVWVRLGVGSEVLSAKLQQVLSSNDVVAHAANGAIGISGVALLDVGTGIAGLTLGAPAPGARCRIRVRALTSGTAIVTTAAGVTFDGTNNTATFNAVGDELVLGYKSATEWVVIENTSVTLSAV